MLARPVQKFFSIKDLGKMPDSGEGWQQVVTMIEKLDGEMMVGLVVDGAAESWSRSGWTGQAKSAIRHASNVPGLLQLVAEVVGRGGSPTFEYVGRQSWVRVRYDQTKLVLVAVRDRSTGQWWKYGEFAQLCSRWTWGVELVQRFGRLEGLTLREINKQVVQWKGVEGAVIWTAEDQRILFRGVVTFGNLAFSFASNKMYLSSIWTAEGQVYKVKSDWWFAVDLKQKRRWYSEAAKQQSTKRGQKRVCHMEREDQRLVVIGWGGMTHPSLLLSALEGAVKVERPSTTGAMADNKR